MGGLHRWIDDAEDVAGFDSTKRLSAATWCIAWKVCAHGAMWSSSAATAYSGWRMQIDLLAGDGEGVGLDQAVVEIERQVLVCSHAERIPLTP